MPLSRTQNNGSKDTGELYVWLSRDFEGVEGIISMPTMSNGFIPLVMTDRKRAEALRPAAQESAKLRGHVAELVVFTRGETLATSNG